MGSSHPRNGPSLAKATYKASRPSTAPSPERRQAEEQQTARDCEKVRSLDKLSQTNPTAGLRALGFPKK
jgi:hypothetical protein